MLCFLWRLCQDFLRDKHWDIIQRGQRELLCRFWICEVNNEFDEEVLEQKNKIWRV